MQLFAEGVNDKELVLLRQLLIDFKFSRVTALADKILDEKGWSAKDLVKNARKQQLKKALDIDALKKSKNYKGVNRQRFNKLVKEINITEPIELLLSQL